MKIEEKEICQELNVTEKGMLNGNVFVLTNHL